jgi:hypothetical protein
LPFAAVPSAVWLKLRFKSSTLIHSLGSESKVLTDVPELANALWQVKA